MGRIIKDFVIKFMLSVLIQYFVTRDGRDGIPSLKMKGCWSSSGLAESILGILPALFSFHLTLRKFYTVEKYAKNKRYIDVFVYI